MKISKSRIFLDIAFLSALFFKVFSLGLRYFPILDDYIQYGGYPLYEKLSYVYLDIGTIATRPFASILDPLVWGEFYGRLWIVVAIVSVLFFFGTKLISLVFEKLDIHITPFLYAVLLLIPLGFEGTYWLSASTRICVGLFFTGLSNFLLTKVILKKKKFFLTVGYILTTILSYGFYESVMILSALLQFFVIISLVKDKKKIFMHLLTPIILGVLMLVYYKIAGNIGALGSRANSFTFSGITAKIPVFFEQFFEILVKGGVLTTVVGAYRGLLLLISSKLGISLLILAGFIAVACAYFGGKLNYHAKAKNCIIMGVALVFLPLLPNILAQEVWLTYRSIVVSFIGLVLVSAPILSPLLKKKTVRTGVIFVMVLVFLLGNANELDTYRRVNECDNALITKIAQQLDNDVLSGNKNTIVVLKEEVTTPQVSYYKDHVKSVFSSDWALTGAIRAKCRNVSIKMLTPVFSLDGIDTQNKQIIYIGGNDG